jgi:hypothetical protein
VDLHCLTDFAQYSMQQVLTFNNFNMTSIRIANALKITPMFAFSVQFGTPISTLGIPLMVTMIVTEPIEGHAPAAHWQTLPTTSP